MENSKKVFIKKRVLLTTCMLLGIISIAGSNQTYVNKLPAIYRTDVEQSLDSLSKILDHVTPKEQEIIPKDGLPAN